MTQNLVLFLCLYNVLLSTFSRALSDSRQAQHYPFIPILRPIGDSITILSTAQTSWLPSQTSARAVQTLDGFKELGPGFRTTMPATIPCQLTTRPTSRSQAKKVLRMQVSKTLTTHGRTPLEEIRQLSLAPERSLHSVPTPYRVHPDISVQALRTKKAAAPPRDLHQMQSSLLL